VAIGTAGVYGAGRRAERPLEDVEGVRILGDAKETMGIEAGEGSTFAHFLTPWGMMLEFVSFPNDRNTWGTGTSCCGLR
jgi:hypothetical protein